MIKMGMNMKEIKVLGTYILMNYLQEKLQYNRKVAKAMLRNECILVNGKVTTQFNTVLKQGDTIGILSSRRGYINSYIQILYEDSNILVVVKPYGLLTIATSKEKQNTLYHFVMEYVKSKNRNNKIFIIHRLDQETSGIVVFAKSEKAKFMYQNNWNQIVSTRKYVAVVEGVMPKKYDTICIGLKETKGYKMIVDAAGKKAITEYSVIQSNSQYSLLDISIYTGKKNQIRVSLSYLKHPIVGDFKYGSKNKVLKRMALHAYALSWIDPMSGLEMSFSLPIPDSFYRISK